MYAYNVGMNICMYLCMYIHMYSMYACMYVFMYVCIMYKHVCTLLSCMYVCMYIYGTPNHKFPEIIISRNFLVIKVTPKQPNIKQSSDRCLSNGLRSAVIRDIIPVAIQ